MKRAPQPTPLVMRTTAQLPTIGIGKTIGATGKEAATQAVLEVAGVQVDLVATDRDLVDRAAGGLVDRAAMVVPEDRVAGVQVVL